MIIPNTATLGLRQGKYRRYARTLVDDTAESLLVLGNTPVTCALDEITGQVVLNCVELQPFILGDEITITHSIDATWAGTWPIVRVLTPGYVFVLGRPLLNSDGVNADSLYTKARARQVLFRVPALAPQPLLVGVDDNVDMFEVPIGTSYLLEAQADETLHMEDFIVQAGDMEETSFLMFWI